MWIVEIHNLKKHLSSQPSSIYIYIVGIKFLSLWKSALDSSFNCFAGGPSNINVGIFRRGFCGFTRADSSIMIKVSS